MRTIKEIREIATAWEKLSWEIRKYSADAVIKECNILEALGEEWGYKIPYDFKVVKGKPYIANSSTHYDFNDGKYYVTWNNGNVGKYQFVDSEVHDYVDEEWEQFIAELDGYKPLDSDPYHDRKIYSFENGKRLMNDYEDICKRTREAMQKKIKKARAEKLKRELEELEVEK